MSWGHDLDEGDPVATARAIAARMIEGDRAAATAGITLEDVAPGQATVTMVVTEDMVNAAGLAHGGFIFLLADHAFAIASNAHGPSTVSRSAHIEYLRPAHAGERLRAVATERSRIGRRGIYDVIVSGADASPVAEFRGHSSGFRAPAA